MACVGFDATDLLWIKDFVGSFFRRHPDEDYYIIPVRLNGSAVETLFSQLKYSTGGHLSSTNYSDQVCLSKDKFEDTMLKIRNIVTLY